MTQVDPPRSTRVRSPAYPNIGLPEAIEKLVVLFQKEAQGRHAIPITAIAKDWEYASVNGSVLAAVSAMKQFGLLDEMPDSDPRQLKLTPRAISIAARGEDSPERIKAIKEAAVSPKLYAALLKRYPLPLPSETTLREHFLADLHFNQKQIAGAIKDFKGSILFARLDNTDKIAQSESPDDGGDETDGAEQMNDLSNNASGAEHLTPPPKPRTPAPLAAGMKQDVFTGDTGNFVVSWPAVVTADDMQDVEAWLDMLKRKIKRSVKTAGDEAQSQ